MKLWDANAKQWVEVEDPAQIQANYLAGTHTFTSDAQVPVEDEYGDAKFVQPGKQVDDVLARGGSITTPERAQQAEHTRKYGGVGNQVAAGALGAVRGASVDVSDALAVEGARVLGGDEAADKTRTYIQGVKEEFPKTSLGTEIVGAVAPGLLSGGETAPESAAEVGTELAASAATKPSIVGTIARYTPAAWVDRAGVAATKAAEGVIGARTASSALGRIAQAAATHAIGDAIPGAIYGAAGQLDEDYLSGGNHALSAEKTIAALGHGALWGVLLGGGLGGAGQAAKEVAAPLLRAASPSLERAAGERMWSAADGTSAQTREAMARVEGGTSAVGNTFLRKSGLGEKSLVEGALTPEELLPLATETRQKTGQELSDFLKAHGAQDTSISAQHIHDAMDSVIAPLRGKALHEGVVGSLEEAKGSVLRALGIGDESLGFMARAKNAGMSLEDYAAKTAAEGGVVPKLRVGLDDLLEQRKAIDQMAYVEAKALNPKMRTEQLREMRSKLSELEVNALDEHAKTAGLSDTAKADYKALKKEYQHLRIYEDAAEEGARKMQTNRKVSITDYGAGLGGVALMAAHGNIPGAVMGVASALGHKIARQRGSALAATTLHKLSKLDILARASEAVDRDLGAAAATFGGKAAKGRTSRFTGPEAGASAKSKWKHARDAYSGSQVVTAEHLERALPGLQTHAPKTSRMILQRLNQAATYAALNAPKPLNKPTLDDPMPEPRVTAQDAEGHYDRIKALEDPVEALAKGAETGRLSAGEYQAIKANYPELLDDFRSKVLDTLSKPHPPLTSDQTRFLGTLFEGGGDELSDPAVASVIQKAYTTQPAPPPAAQGMTKTKPIEGLADSSKMRLGAVRAQHSPGQGA